MIAYLPSGALQVAYAKCREYHAYLWLEWKNDAADELLSQYPSLKRRTRAFGQHVSSFLENRFGLIAVSETKGLVALSVAPVQSGKQAEEWCRAVDLTAAVTCFGMPVTDLDVKTVFVKANGRRWHR